MPRKLSQPNSAAQQKDASPNERGTGTQQVSSVRKHEGDSQSPQTIQPGWDQSISRLEVSVVDHLSKILESDQHCVVSSIVF